METSTQNQAPTFESVWALLQENAIQMKETDRKMKETDRKIDKLQATMGSWATNHGFFAEEYFINSFEQKKQNFFGEKFDEIEKNLKGIKKGFKDEYDIVLFNGNSVAIIEIKFKAHENDIPKIIRKATTFRVNFPDYKSRKIYLGLATMNFYEDLEKECVKNGIAVIKQVGDTIVINPTNLKVY